MTAVTARPAGRRTRWRRPPAARSDQPRITLVVDHPLRDLPGMVLTAVNLCRRGATCYLTSLNLCDLEVCWQAPDFVLANYYRKNFRHFFQLLADYGIGIGVLDTEGGVMESIDAFASDLVADASLRAAVGCYCCWGPKVAAYLREQQLFAQRQLRVTGCPRTDFYASPWRSAVQDLAAPVARYRHKLILLNANFSIGNPGFLTVQQQHRLLAENLGHDPQRVRNWQQQEQQGLRQLAGLANELARSFPDATVVYRPHPFERLETYDDLLAPLANLHCVRAGSVDAWLMNAAVVIQRSCSTSIEAGMAGTVALMPRWIPTPFERPAANRTSTPCDDPRELVDTVAQVLAGRFEQPPAVAASYQEVIRDWFHCIDGRAHERVADAILGSVDCSAAARTRRRRALHRDAYGLQRSLWSRKRWRGALLAALGRPPTRSLLGRTERPIQPERFQHWDRSAKRFDVDQVQRIVSAALRCRGDAGHRLTVEAARGAADHAFGHGQARAVKIAPPGAGQGI